MELLDRIDTTSAMPMYMQVANAIVTDIESGTLRRDKQLPSINELSESYYLSRDTVEKAYQLLRKRGVIVSIKCKGCYVSDSFTPGKLRVLLLFNKLSTYKKNIYYAILNSLGEDAEIDLHIHHFDGKICESLLQESLGKYQYYAIMPHFDKNVEEARQAIKKIPEEQLLFLDKKFEGFEGKCAAVYQDFDRDIRHALHLGKDLLAKHKRMVMIYPEDVTYPLEIVKGFRHFCREISFEHKVVSSIRAEELRNTVFVALNEPDLIEIIERSRAEGLVAGKDFGIISYNDTPLMEVLENGITVVSTDHEKMGLTAAYMMKHKLKDSIKNPFSFIRRNSL
ncbi:GntR family transcriptional regulator [Pontibacter qinzhouensis]|uniref:GntR family transcriptional regulator n=1 Tax=Pontibacter qinzhouensis TaxID=2603253 RepID=A0A5C8K9Y6_9BACT|nr:GntR family transcriptional regulator [Pontibacter qinzhouensis]TXK46053.1 GntR family transcriptional regulator [Pontibacter qinzhouensis]